MNKQFEQVDPLLQINDESLEKYKAAGLIAKKAVDRMVHYIDDCGKKDNGCGIKLILICCVGEKFIESELGNIYKNVSNKGLSFPICLSLNETAGHYIPQDTDILTSGDVLKIELGVQIDGYSGNIVYTTYYLSKLHTKFDKSKTLKAICTARACIYASKEIAGIMKPGTRAKQIVQILEKYSQKYQCELPISNVDGIVPGILSYQISRNVLDGFHDGKEEDNFIHRFILNRENPQYDFTMYDNELEENEIYTIDILMCSGSGKLNQNNNTRIYGRNYEVAVPLKLKSSKHVLGLMRGNYYPMVLDQTTGQVRLGLVDCIKKGIVKSYSCVSSKDGDIISRIKFTVLVSSNPVILCGKVADPELEKFKNVEKKIGDLDLKKV